MCEVLDSRRVDVAGGRSLYGVDLTLPGDALLEGLVRGADGSPARGARVLASTGSGEPSPATTDASGRFRLKGLKRSRYRVTATSGWVWTDAECEATPEALEVDLESADTGSVELQLAAMVSVHVNLTDESGKRAEAPLEAVDALGRTIEAANAALLLSPGIYLLRARHDQRWFEQPLVLAATRRNVKVQFVLE
jgi:hypothetical protein